MTTLEQAQARYAASQAAFDGPAPAAEVAWTSDDRLVALTFPGRSPQFYRDGEGPISASRVVVRYRCGRDTRGRWLIVSVTAVGTLAGGRERDRTFTPTSSGAWPRDVPLWVRTLASQHRPTEAPR